MRLSKAVLGVFGFGAFSLAVLGLGAVGFGCSAEAPPDYDGGFAVIVAAASSGGCTATSNKNHNFPPEVDRILLRVSGGGSDAEGPVFEAVIRPSDLTDKGEVLVTGVAPAQDRQMDMYGCVGEELRWSARSTNVTVVADQKTAPRFFFTQKNTLSCTGSELADGATWTSKMNPGRAFHAAVSVTGERVLLVGGFNIFKGSETPVLVAQPDQPSITEYDWTRGTFHNWEAGLVAPRGLATLVPFDEGRKVLVIGGLTRVELAAAPNAPIVAAPEDDAGSAQPAHLVEIIDVASQTSSASPLALQPLPMTAVAHSEDGLKLVLAGGWETNGQPSNLVEHTAASSSQLADGTATVVRGKLITPRAGNTATFFEGAKTLVVGGNFDKDPAHLVEVLDAAFEAHEVALEGDTLPAPMAHHQTVLLRSDGCKHAFLISGGVPIFDAGGQPSFGPAQKNETPLLLFELDGCTEGAWTGRFSDQSGLADASRLQRTLHQVTALGPDRLVVSGGMSLTTAVPDPAPEACYSEETASGCFLNDVMLLSVGGTSTSDVSLQLMAPTDLTFGTSRFGHNVQLLVDGTALISGGIRARSTKVDNLLSATDLFNPLSADDAGRCKN